MATTPSASKPAAPLSAVLKAHRSYGGRVSRVCRRALKTRRGQIGLALTLFVFAVAFLGPLVPTVSPLALLTYPFRGPGHGAGPLGADVLGRSVLARVLDGGWRLMLLSLAATTLACGLGVILGITAAYRGGWIDGLIMRSVDVVLGIPQLVFVLMLLSVLGPKTWLIIVAVGVSQAPQVARVIRAAAQDVSERDYVKAVAAWGVPPRTVIRRHVVPSLITPLMVEFSLRLSFAIVLVAGLSFLGLGTQPPNPDWGVMINENRLGMSTNIWAVLAPSILLAILAVGVNTFSDAIARANLHSGAAGDPSVQLIVAESGVGEGADDDADAEAIDEVLR
jgi:peptide/nickel transport system permease protein